MTTAYAQCAPQAARPYTPPSALRLAVSAPGQGREARKVRDNVRDITMATTASQGYSVESTALKAAIREMAESMTESIEALQAMFHSSDTADYKPVPMKPAFTVQATYTLLGKMAPRQFPEIE